MKYLFVVNPTAGGTDRTEEIRTSAQKLFAGRPGDEFEIYVTKFKGDDASEVRRRAQTGEELRIIACGGDGTFNGCCNGAAGYYNVSVCPYPAGTGNDFCRMFGDEKELFLDLEAIADGTPHKIDLINVNGTYCVCIASLGFDARVGTHVHDYTHLPLCSGTGGYVMSLLHELTQGLSTPMKISCGDFIYNGDVTLCCICNGRHYGGGFNPTVTAMPDDGELEIIIVKKVNLLQLAVNIGKYSTGRASEIGDLAVCLKGSSITVEADGEIIVNTDGEMLQAKKIEMKLEPGRVNLTVPRGITFFEKRQ